MAHRALRGLAVASLFVVAMGAPACGGSDFVVPESPDVDLPDGTGDSITGDGADETADTLDSGTPDDADSTVTDSGDSAVADSDTGGGDTGVDSGTDTGVDSTVDTGTDTGTDAGADTGVDSGTDTGTDTGVDSGTDTGTDTGVDTGTDTGTDTGSDAGSCSAPVTCYGGAAAELTYAATACRSGVSYCVSGTYGPCIGEVRPTSEACNGIDDDCNGSIDDALGTITCGVGACANTVSACAAGKPGTCTPKAAGTEVCGDGIDNNCNGLIDDGCSCVYVSPTGNDSTGTGASSAPYRTIAKGISMAGTGGLPMQVCVASTATCGTSSATTTYSEAITMRNGVSVYGGYSPVGSTWARAAGCITVIQAVDVNGVQFPSTVTSTTILDGFGVLAASSSSSTSSAAITVTGSTGAVVSNDAVSGSNTATSVGILVQDASGTRATPVIRDSLVSGGTGATAAMGIRVLRSSPTITHNCTSFDTAGRCNVWPCGGGRSIRGRNSGSIGAAGSETYAIRLEDASGTVVDTSAVCSADGQGNVSAIRLSGASTGVLIRQNSVLAPAGATGNVNAVGVWADACAGASPWILDNYYIAASSRTVGGRADGVRAVGNCHPRIDSNLQIVGGEESAANDAIGVYCARDSVAGTSSRCTVLGNSSIRGSNAGFPPNSIGVKCDSGACARIERNNITGSQGVNTFGVVLNGAATFVDRNVIDAGCTTGEGIGLQAIDAPARVQNNVIRGAGFCTPGGGTLRSPTSTYGVRVYIGSGTGELDLNSNSILALGGTTPACTGRAISFEAMSGATPGGPRGIVRNSILHAGVCATTYGVVEVTAAADPRVFEANDIWYSTAPTAIYRNEGSTDLMTIAAVNGLTDITVTKNISSDPLWVGALNYHLTLGSPCRNAGVTTFAPLYDWEGDTRPLEGAFDIGADEYRP